MKRKKMLIISCVLIAVILVGAFAIWPSIRLKSDQGDSVDLAYTNAHEDTDAGVLTLYADYESYGTFFEIAIDIVVATDKDFTNVLRKTGCTVEESRYAYTFVLEESTDKIYISPPILYLPVEVETTSVSLNADSKTKFDDQDWFSVSSIDTKEAGEGMFMVTVTIKPHNETLPRYPKLVVGGEEIGGFSSLNFNEDAVFDFGEFIFYLPAESIETASSMLKDASLVVEDALIKVAATDTIFTSNIKSLNVVAD